MREREREVDAGVAAKLVASPRVQNLPEIQGNWRVVATGRSKSQQMFGDKDKDRTIVAERKLRSEWTPMTRVKLLASRSNSPNLHSFQDLLTRQSTEIERSNPLITLIYVRGTSSYPVSIGSSVYSGRRGAERRLLLLHKITVFAWNRDKSSSRFFLKSGLRTTPLRRLSVFRGSDD